MFLGQGNFAIMIVCYYHLLVRMLSISCAAVLFTFFKRSSGQPVVALINVDPKSFRISWSDKIEDCDNYFDMMPTVRRMYEHSNAAIDII